MTYAFTGCSGAVSANAAAIRIVWGTLPNLGGKSLKVPVIHGVYEIVPRGWDGDNMTEYVRPPRYSDPVETEDIAIARTLDFWREPTVPEDWEFDWAASAGGDAYGGPTYGYCASYLAAERTFPGTSYRLRSRGIEICAGFTISRYVNQVAYWGVGAHETRVIAGRPARLMFSPPGPEHDPGFPTRIEVFDPETEVTYRIQVYDYDLKSNTAELIEMARSLFENPNPQ